MVTSLLSPVTIFKEEGFKLKLTFIALTVTVKVFSRSTLLNESKRLTAMRVVPADFEVKAIVLLPFVMFSNFIEASQTLGFSTLTDKLFTFSPVNPTVTFFISPEFMVTAFVENARLNGFGVGVGVGLAVGVGVGLVVGAVVIFGVGVALLLTVIVRDF